MYSIETRDLTKKYGDFVAVDHISFTVKRGEIFGLLGPNGAGKTTTIKMLTGLTPPTEGDALVAGFSIVRNPIEVKSRIGWISSEVILDDDLTGWENLEIQARLTGVKNWKERATELLKYFGILEFKDRKAGKFSTGMRKKLEIAMALLNSPEVIFMDEPTIGLDVNTRATMWNLIRQINKDYEVTVLLTTHYMEEADSLCNRLGIINKGRIIAMDTPEELKNKYGGDVIEIELKPGAKLNVSLENTQVTDSRVRIRVNNAESALMDVIRAVGGDNIKGIRVNKSSLDVVFINLTGGTMEEQEFDARRFYAMIRRARR
ncbi:daunorubicin resistance ABC transporter ATP-binding subunit [Metallosphaera yellowstonensis MK1]|jgi:ABC-2 type transport system ATP-binding protein|uniref:Daunorubicin resistance ABC transporter ATP-binding subunit n=1 Tax=Metallosphaera yellowstonensis MK1 TaxID=671065 RepID=H2C5Y8_9CREN|nr:daunorubicin resistance protein DrrA family ABC transporter ATP-binding protein [Metallosphaera yellowstonensis]EHP69215.1 daunorubicin resistance ABC transporter ATP-binding subunit [Metallosphaera yellowstonensis MK1]